MRLYRGTDVSALYEALSGKPVSGLWSADKIYPIYWLSSIKQFKSRPVVLEAVVPLNAVYDMQKTEGIGAPWFEPKGRNRMLSPKYIVAVWEWKKSTISEAELRKSVGLKSTYWKRTGISQVRTALSRKLGVSIVSMQQFVWLLSVGWSVRKEVHKSALTGHYWIDLKTPRRSYVKLGLYEYDRYLRVWSISSEVKGSGYGTSVVNALRMYCDAKHKGLFFDHVENEAFFDRFKWLHPTFDIESHPYFSYTYNMEGVIK